MQATSRVSANCKIKRADKDNTANDISTSNIDVPVAGFLFNHGPEGINDSLDVSMSTTGYDDGDGEFPHCVDSSLLLSPKADLPEINENNVKVLSQDVPNFLSGLRKTGLSFFGAMTDDSTKSDPNMAISKKPNDNSFSFSFGGEEKKSRIGLFNMFN